MAKSPNRPTPRLQIEGAARPPIAGTFLVCAALLIGATAFLTIQLTGQAVEDRVEVELVHTARLLGGGGFPLNDDALLRMSEFIGADVVAVDGQRQVRATSLIGERRADFEAACRLGTIPGVTEAARVTEATLPTGSYTLGIAPLPGHTAPGGVYVLYPANLVAQQSRQAWLPVTLVAVIAMLLAVLLGVFSERIVQRQRTSALLRLLVSVAHEIRNPLGAIRTLASSLKNRLGPDVDGEPLEIIAAEADRLGLLVDGLRQVGLPIRTIRREVDPNEAVRSVLGLIEHQLAHRRVRVEGALELGAKIEADPAQVRQVILNLALNAADAMPRGGTIRFESQIDSRRDGDHWVLVVEDSGPGVPPAVRPRLFEPFFTTKPRGLGVGLYMCRRLVEAHGGTLALDPTGTAGARFVVSWPTATETAINSDLNKSDDPSTTSRGS